jgi:hypothetical protein
VRGATAETRRLVGLAGTGGWQAATAQGWTTWVFPDHIVVGGAAVLVALFVARLAWGDDDDPSGVLIAGLLGAGFAVTGSGLVPLLGAVLIELIGGRDPEQPATVAQAAAVRPQRGSGVCRPERGRGIYSEV